MKFYILWWGRASSSGKLNFSFGRVHCTKKMRQIKYVGHHHHWVEWLGPLTSGQQLRSWFFDSFGVRSPLVSMVYDGCPPLVQRWNGCLPSSKSNTCKMKKKTMWLVWLDFHGWSEFAQTHHLAPGAGGIKGTPKGCQQCDPCIW